MLEGICDIPLKYVDEMNSTQSRSQVLYIFQFLLMFILFFPLGTFFHRALRNIKTLREWIAENDEGLHKYNDLREADLSHPVEKIGKELRSMMPWLESTT